jgi:hypothetical protein
VQAVQWHPVMEHVVAMSCIDNLREGDGLTYARDKSERGFPQIFILHVPLPDSNVDFLTEYLESTRPAPP